MFSSLLEVPELEAITKNLNANDGFNKALQRIDQKLINDSVSILSDCIYEIETNSKLSDQQLTCSTPLLKRQCGYASYVLFHHLDESGLSTEIMKVAPDILECIDFSSNKAFQNIEYLLARQSGLSRVQISRISEVIDENKTDLKAIARESNTGIRFGPLSSIAVSATDGEANGVGGAGTVLAGVNTAFLVAPEPLISKGIGAASVLTGIVANLFD